MGKVGIHIPTDVEQSSAITRIRPAGKSCTLQSRISLNLTKLNPEGLYGIFHLRESFFNGNLSPQGSGSEEKTTPNQESPFRDQFHTVMVKKNPGAKPQGFVGISIRLVLHNSLNGNFVAIQNLKGINSLIQSADVERNMRLAFAKHKVLLHYYLTN